MDWQDTLIQLYLYITKHYENQLAPYAERFSNNQHPPRFTDEEVLTIYLFGLIRGHKTIQAIYTYTHDHLASWFPALISYGGYVQRLNRLCDLFPVLIEEVLRAYPVSDRSESVRLIDSMPIILAQEKRSSQACVAPELANKGYCASKRMFYYGVKLHVLGRHRAGTLPLPEYIGVTSGSEHDLVALRRIAGQITDSKLFGDKAFQDAESTKQLAQKQNVGLFTPVKKQKGQDNLSLTDRAYSAAVSRVRQPIESLFNWIEEKTGIQCASKVRSYQGLLVHVFGRLAAAMYLLVFNP
jgi:hypothetical protein